MTVAHQITMPPDGTVSSVRLNGVCMAAILLATAGFSILHAAGFDVAALPLLLMVLLILRTPEYVVLLLLALTVSISYPSHSIIHLPGSEKGFSAIELVLLFLVVSALLRHREWRGYGIGRSGIGRTFILYQGWLLLVLFWQVAIRGNPEVNPARGYFLLMLVLPCAVLLKEDRQWFTVFRGLVVLALISGVTTIIIYSGVGSLPMWHDIIGSFRIDEYLLEGNSGPPRVLLGGVYLAYAIGMVSLALPSVHARGSGYWFVFMLFAGVVLAVSFTRALGVTFILSIVMMFLAGVFWRKAPVPPARIAGVGIAAAAIGALLIAGGLLHSDVLLQRYLSFSAITDAGDVFLLDSMIGRTWENAVATGYIVQDPLFGGGFGISLLERSPFAASAVPHNALISLMFLFGVPGGVLFSILALTYSITSWKLLRSSGRVPAHHRPWLYGFLFAFAGLTISSISAQYVTVKAAPLVAVMMGYSHYLAIRHPGSTGEGGTVDPR